MITEETDGLVAGRDREGANSLTSHHPYADETAVHALAGYNGGGKAMIVDHESEGAPDDMKTLANILSHRITNTFLR